MRKIVYVLLLVLSPFIILMNASCSKKEVKQVSQESKISQEAFALADIIKKAFLKNDTVILRNNSTEDGFKDITANKRLFDSVDINFTPRWVEIESDKIYVNIAWKSRWIISGRASEERGMAVFVMEGRPLKVSKILRANPFIFSEQ
ncbi:MAG: hypothetical protein AB1632_14035 [Nitrospirota bacterium]